MASSVNSRKNNANGSAQEKAGQTETSKPGKTKTPATGKKVVIRRLPPGMTAEEAWNILGDEWKDGNGKVDWSQFQAGKISQDPSFPSTPARCYLHLIRTEDIAILSEMVQRSTWEDAKRTMNDSALVGPPYVEIAQFQKVPTAKRRTDPRQGTIDQDPEFQAFLQALTQPTPAKEPDNEQSLEETATEDTKVTTTPLVQYLKEKKANKAKEAANAKSAKHTRHESQGGKTKSTAEDSKKKGKETKAEKSEKPSEKEKDKSKEPVKLLTKKAAIQEAAEAAKSVAAQTATNKPAEEPTPQKSRRAGIAAAAKILQRDLGLSPGSAHRRARQDAAKAEAAAKSDAGKESKESKESTPAAPPAETASSSVPPSTPTAPKSQTSEGSRRSRNKAAKQNNSKEDAKGKGSEASGAGSKPKPQPTPIILKRKDNAAASAPGAVAAPAAAAGPSTPMTTPPTGPKASSGKAVAPGKPAASASQKKGSSQPSVTAGATRAFVKHANPSQGVTDALLKEAMEGFGPVTFVEIDKRKGFAYVDFGDHEGLVKAVAASPVSIAQTTVQVLERKETKKPAPSQSPSDNKEKAPTETPADRPKRGGRGRGRKGGGAQSGIAAITGEPAASSSKAAPAASGEAPSPAAPS
ncbi:hypothetical protein DL764_004345 [Monosporascus ibericus]|uniref:RRM domain-containing protein n=1 Tax=Monosporascus ibericus TaxID=155417 RepID=A0A4Q4TDI3_9PEZI|nr:hypothetical protein DL764_004345 [Monosporascus ibericus]